MILRYYSRRRIKKKEKSNYIVNLFSFSSFNVNLFYRILQWLKFWYNIFTIFSLHQLHHFRLISSTFYDWRKFSRISKIDRRKRWSQVGDINRWKLAKAIFTFVQVRWLCHGDTDTMIQAPSSYSWTVLPCPSLGEGGEYSKLSYDSRKLDSKSLQNHHPLESVSS